MPREVLEPKDEKQDEIDNLKERLAEVEGINELLKGCVMELAAELFN